MLFIGLCSQIHILLFQDTVLVIGFLADFTAAYSSNSGMNMDITLKTNNNEYNFNRINSDNAVVLQKIQVTKKTASNFAQLLLFRCCFRNNNTMAVTTEVHVTWLLK